MSLNNNQARVRAKGSIRSIPVKYTIDSLEFAQILAGGFVAKVKISTTIFLQSTNAVSFAELQNNEINLKAKVKQENQSALNKLVSDFVVGFNPKSKEISFESQITLGGNQSGKQVLNSKVSIDPMTGQPAYTVSLKYPEIKGQLNNQAYIASQYEVIMTITQNNQRQRQMPAVLLVPVTQTNPDWTYAIATGLVVGAVVIIAGTITEDVFTGFIGAWNDAPCFSAAATMLGRAWTMVRANQMSVTLGASSAAMVSP